MTFSRAGPGRIDFHYKRLQNWQEMLNILFIPPPKKRLVQCDIFSRQETHSHVFAAIISVNHICSKGTFKWETNKLTVQPKVWPKLNWKVKLSLHKLQPSTTKTGFGSKGQPAKMQKGRRRRCWKDCDECRSRTDILSQWGAASSPSC